MVITGSVTSGNSPGIPWSLLDAYDVITFDAKFEHLFILMALTFLASVFSNMRSYR